MYYASTEDHNAERQKKIIAKCPDCGAMDTLSLEFFQKRVLAGDSEKVTTSVSGILYCHHTQTEIPQVLWTDEIEHYFHSEKQKFNLGPKRTRVIQKFQFRIALLILTSLAILFGFFFENFPSHKSLSIETIAPGNAIKISYAQVTPNTRQDAINTWFVIKKIDSDSVWLQKQHFPKNLIKNQFDSQKSIDVPEKLKVSYKKLQQWIILPHEQGAYSFSGFVMEIN